MDACQTGAMPLAADSPNAIATLRIELYDTDPLIWRQVEIPTGITLKQLHDVVQAAMDWDDQHLWELRQDKHRFSRTSAGKTRLFEILKPRKTVLDYTYDFGDSWDHRLTLTDVRPGDPKTAYPRYVAGENAAPPEDCGGVPGFYTGLEALADPAHPDHEYYAEWFEGFDLAALDEPALAAALARLARRLGPAKATTARKAKG